MSGRTKGARNPNALVACPPDKHCLGCYFYRGDHVKMCNYMLFTGVMRPCPPGEGCTVKVGRKDLYMKKPTWDTDAGRQMWLDGKSDNEIADEFHISAGAVTSYRKKHWDPQTARGGETLKLRQCREEGGRACA